MQIPSALRKLAKRCVISDRKKGHGISGNSHFSIEKLEPRQMMAADMSVSFAEDSILAYDASQDREGSWAIENEASTLSLQGNTWKAVQVPYVVTPNTVLEFSFSSTSEGEVHAIGIDTDLDFKFKEDLFFTLYGTQTNFGNSDFETYDGSGYEKMYRIAIGEQFQGLMKNLVFANDHDVANPDAQSSFSKIRLYEDPLRFSNHPFVDYGGKSESENGRLSQSSDHSIHLSGNTWQAMLLNYDVTSQTRLSFDYMGIAEGELQGIGIDTDLELTSEDIWFQLDGTEDSFGIQDFNTATVGVPKHYDIPIGDFFQGDIKYLTFGNDHDVDDPSATSIFANVRLYEEGLDFNEMSLVSYGGSKQDVNGLVATSSNGSSIQITGNTWKAVNYNYTVTPNTVIEFEFEGDVSGELHGIGVDTDLTLSRDDYWFSLWGSQSNFGMRDYFQQNASLNRHTIPIGEYMTGEINYITFGNDHDVANPNAESQFKNVRIYEVPQQASESAFNYEVVVYAGTPSGVMSAVEAARQGKSVVLIEPGDHLGGMMSSGLGRTDARFRDVAIGGLSREFFERVKTYYDDPSAWTSQNPEDFEGYDPNSDTMWLFEPHVAEAIFDDLVDELFIPVIRNERLDREDGVTMTGESITSISTENGMTFEGQVFVDASYEGDLMAAAGVTYTVGREDWNLYCELHGGVQTSTQLAPSYPIDAYVIPGDPSSGLIPGVHAESIESTGTGDDRVQAYNYRLTLTDDPSNMVPFEKPENYDESLYELYFRYWEAGNSGRNIFSTTGKVPNLKTDSNGASAFSIDVIGENYDYADASYEEREEILQYHKDFIQGLLWTSANHPRVPANVRNRNSNWGFAADEYLDNDNWPYQIYVRESRRMVSDYVMVESNGVGNRVAEDPIGLGTYNLDSHYVRRYVGESGEVLAEGNIQVDIDAPFGISYRSLVPKVGEANNLIVPVAVSASHVAYGGIRLEPTYMIMGQSAGIAASLVIDTNTTVQELDYNLLRQELLDAGQILE